ncbi:NAPB_3 [Blepharisma stoltei]|uniref:Alpha-SNAP n=1 Tax=Blepharisma stoltei TaxID=1481888 RepID=A0AAU9K5A1_9CILI|nr:unnamed protein product [Blepharisma stoltei]
MVEDSNYIRRAQEAFNQAEKKCKPGVFGRMFSNRDARLEEASELYKQAANYYRLGKDYISSARSFCKCAECVPDEAANYYSEAGNVVRKVNSADAVSYYNRAVEILVNSSRISQAARLRKQIAEIYETDEMLGLAVENYLQAAELFELDNSDGTANSCHLKAAELSTLDSLDSETILKAIKIFELVGQRYLMNNLTRFSAKDCYFKAALLFLANDDTVGAENNLNMYSNRDPSFETSRECRFVRDLLAAIRSGEQSDFEVVTAQFNKITPLDRWKTHVLLKVKSTMLKAEENDFI